MSAHDSGFFPEIEKLKFEGDLLEVLRATKQRARKKKAKPVKALQRTEESEGKESDFIRSFEDTEDTFEKEIVGDDEFSEEEERSDETNKTIKQLLAKNPQLFKIIQKLPI